MHKSPIESLLADREVMDDIQNILESKKKFPRCKELPRGESDIASYLKRPIIPVESRYETADAMAEAIVLTVGRPVLLISDGQIETPQVPTWQTRLSPVSSKIEQVIPSVGRVELFNHPDYEWVGTAWHIDDNILVTNRHVAQIFARRQGQRFIFRSNLLGESIQAQIDFREEYQRSAEFEIAIEEVIFINEPGQNNPDIAFLRLAPNSNLPDPIPLATNDALEGDLVGVIGYPAYDSRNSGPAISRIFRDIFDVKRFAPGFVTDQENSNNFFEHDCTTLGGNSGSVVFNLNTGEAVGLHFAGRFRVSNYAVKASTIRHSLARIGISISSSTSDGDSEERRPEDYDDREGYQEQFLGDDPQILVPLPQLRGELRSDAVQVSRNRGMSAFSLDYTHFSVIMSKSRKLAIYTAVNIDGTQEVRVRRGRTRWKIDPRISRDYQSGNELYRHNPLDRGHLVRRLDPVWGNESEARQANDDTFHYTNSAPQHERFNQRIWLNLEDYLLNNANTRDFKVSVFTGPVFNERDPIYRGVKIPEEYWKVIAMVNPSGELHSTGYMLSQGRLLDDLEFVFGRFRTYQVPISVIEEQTNINFGELKDFDPLREIEGSSFLALQSLEDIRVI